MSVEANKALVRRYQDIYNSNNLDELSEVLAPGFVSHSTLPGVPATLEGFKQVHQMSVAAYPDIQASIEDLFAEGDKVVMRFVYTGTHQGDFMGVPPTGVKINVPGISIFRIADGQIAEHWGEEDALGWMQQIGAIPKSEPAGL